MKLVTIKTAKETGIPGIQFVTVDKAIVEIVIGKLHIRKGESYSKALEVVIEKPFETIEKHRLTATIEGFAPSVSHHDTEYEAASAGAKLEDKGAVIKIEQVEVQVDDSGEVHAPVITEDDLPF